MTDQKDDAKPSHKEKVPLPAYPELPSKTGRTTVVVVPKKTKKKPEEPPPAPEPKKEYQAQGSRGVV